ncbi:response regulator [Chitinophaga arvensicola]|uniref:DNA-binding response regulator, NarL/FixJ family, contains REC and HTH domains n=1 Tax=Chitinophaga arvensicola TaxID=29529 RepID=A0A1I0S7U8_9BACT|nr:response regulator transcription factor [Chitinophaga arvensicola]SEW51822.1 DNA-binding response regulator, NarL/FixJ family, contains REC and HTH domains [Chitinophaga arvensicola]
MIKVLLIDDHPIVMEGLKNLLTRQEDLTVAGCFSTGKAGLEGITTLQPDVVLLDINLPDISGIEICQQVRKQDKDVRIIALSVHNERLVIKNILNSGANGYVLKNSVGEEIIMAINAALNGATYLCRATRDIVSQVSEGELTSIPRITRREKEIMGLVSKGFTTAQIADQLFISPHTVESHRKNLIEKFDVSTMTAVIKLATQFGLI